MIDTNRCGEHMGMPEHSGGDGLFTSYESRMFYDNCLWFQCSKWAVGFRCGADLWTEGQGGGAACRPHDPSGAHLSPARAARQQENGEFLKEHLPQHYLRHDMTNR